jgi:septal ring factor EnvC (AmiA/AmiB activator)
LTSPITFPNATVNVTITADLAALAGHILDPLLARLDQLETNMTQSFTTVDEALAALDTKADSLATAEAADRAAFDALAAAVRAFLANLPPAGSVVTPEQSAQADAILAKLDTVAASDTAQAGDETTLQGEVPPVA